MQRKILLTLVSTFMILVSVFPIISTQVFAQATGQPSREGALGTPSRETSVNNTCSGNDCRLTNPFKVNNVSQLVDAILDILIKVGWVLAFFFLIYSGFLFVTAGGSEDQIRSAKAVFMWTLIGSAIVLGAKAISVMIQSTIIDVVGR